ncbi:MAG TPA: protease, partial [Bacteroidales bacterium]|nr:protease [Bacteroidales bacterium]
MKKKTSSIIWVLFYYSTLYSQVSTGEIPPSFSSKLKSKVKSEFLAKPDIARLLEEDAENDKSNRPYRVATMMDVEYCVSGSGSWDTLSTGERIWRLNIYSPDAQGLQLNYSNFKLPPGARLFVYNENKTFVRGAFTNQNNDTSGNFATEIVPGESCIVELALSPYTTEVPEFCITQVGYVYRGVDFFVPESSRLKASGACQVNINCSPEGDNWKDVKRAVARIYMNGYYCTGTLLNNTAQDFKNYFATAFHCIDGLTSSSSNWLFYFNYEHSTCSNTSTNITPNTITGATVKASTPINGGGDGALLLLNGTIPSTYKVYYAGWNRADSAVSGGACIHHPQGDRKKIATVRDKWYTSTWYGENDVIGAKNAHWYVVFAPTPNGHSVTEGGSSGSGIFGNDELFRGSLSGGNSSCDIPSGSNLFGKLSYNWDKYSSTPNQQYKVWLDP